MGKRVGHGGPRRLAGWGAVAACLTLGVTAAAASSGEFVAGTAPDRRPEGAPRLTTFAKSPQWLASATTGISQPLPPSLKFLDNQGAWFTPFTHRGMEGPYDIRGWYAAGASGAKQPPPK